VSVLSVRLQIRRKGRKGAATGDFELDVDFSVPPGVTVLFGPSGAGKSTILAAIAGLVRPDLGRIALGEDVWFEDGRALAVHRRGVAFVFQSLALFPHMTAIDNVAYGIARAVPAGERRTRAAEMLARMRVAHLADRKPRTFSGGEAQRVALARACAMSPRVLLLDEPFSALDRDLRVELCADVRAMVEALQIPAVLVTHHRNEALAVGDEVVLLDHGAVKGKGHVEDLLSEPTPAAEGRSQRARVFEAIGKTPIPVFEKRRR
jgi:molybdate transport system ATP-binding protein